VPYLASARNRAKCFKMHKKFRFCTRPLNMISSCLVVRTCVAIAGVQLLDASTTSLWSLTTSSKTKRWNKSSSDNVAKRSSLQANHRTPRTASLVNSLYFQLQLIVSLNINSAFSCVLFHIQSGRGCNKCLQMFFLIFKIKKNMVTHVFFIFPMFFSKQHLNSQCQYVKTSKVE